MSYSATRKIMNIYDDFYKGKALPPMATLNRILDNHAIMEVDYDQFSFVHPWENLMLCQNKTARFFGVQLYQLEIGITIYSRERLPWGKDSYKLYRGDHFWRMAKLLYDFNPHDHRHRRTFYHMHRALFDDNPNILPSKTEIEEMISCVNATETFVQVKEL